MLDHVDYEARTATRVPLAAPVWVRTGGGDRVVRSRDASATGLFLWTVDSAGVGVRVGEALELLVHGDDASVRCHAEVTRVVEPGSPEWAAYPTGVAVRITGCGEVDRAALATLLARA